MMINLFLAILPTIIIVTYFLKFDRYNPEPPRLLFRLFLGGCISVIPAVIIEMMIDEPAYPTYFNYFVYCCLGIGLVEEGCKYFFTKLLAYRSNAFDEIYDGIIYCVMVSLGFATIENILYVMQYGTSVAITRMITAVPAHAIFAATMGYYMGYGKAFPRQRTLYKILSIVIPTILHGFYDYILTINANWALIVFVVYLIWLYKRTFRLIRITHEVPPFK